MAAKLLSKLFWMFAFLCFFLLVNVERQSDRQGKQRSDSSSPKLIQPKIKEIESRFPEFSAIYNRVHQETDPDKRLTLIDTALSGVDKKAHELTPFIRKLNVLAAEIHESRWHFHFALNYLMAAQKLDFSKDIDRRIKRIRKHLAQYEEERNFNLDYIATRDTGPAKALKGKVLVAYIFIDDGIKTRWSKKSMQRSEAVLSSVEQWKKTKAKEYSISNVSFVNKSFIVRRNPNLKKYSGVSFRSSMDKVEKYIEIVMQTLGEKSVGNFIQKQMKLEGADQGVVFFHNNFDERSFAKRCGYTHIRTFYVKGEKKTEYISKCQDEFVMLMNQVKRNRWDKLHYTQAHEMLHVFGADDLYSIKGAREYAVTDIMNYQSKKLSDSQIHPVTAYAIGWQKEPPKSPFKIIDR
ncbi:MAG: hypothetical protein OQK51_23680 [Kangiellaceae bacterium]|nr:hypothetical protein [Kangiellaceae bacterium]